MYTSFQNLSDAARIWIYQTDRQLTHAEVNNILQRIEPFLETWSPHGAPLITSAEIRHAYFLIFGVEETSFKLSCCTIDPAIRLLQTIGEEIAVNFLDRTKVVLQVGTQYLLLPMHEVKAKLKQGVLPPDTKVFNNVITHKQALARQWLIPIHLSWLAK
jgi:hypothetical protein